MKTAEIMGHKYAPPLSPEVTDREGVTRALDYLTRGVQAMGRYGYEEIPEDFHKAATTLYDLQQRLMTAPQFSTEQIDKAAQQLFALDNPIARWPSVNHEAYRREAKSILDAALTRS